jgi:hypothetical protein
MKRRALVAVAALALAGVIGFVAQGGGSIFPAGGSSSNGSAGGTSGSGAAAPERRSAPEDGVLDQAPRSLTMSLESPGPTAVPGLGAQVIKDASLSLRVKRQGLRAALDAATATAARFGGFVQSSSSSGRAGSVLLRIPQASFDAALNELGDLGTVTSRSESGKDVTSEFVDLNARLITWRSQETVLLRLMDRAASISDTLRIQSQLQQVQFRIEQIRGALRVLRSQTSYGTIDLAIREVGAPVSTSEAAATPSLVRAWQQSWAGFVGVLSAVIVGLGYLVPVCVLGLIGWAVFRRVSRPRAAPAATTAS